MWILGLKGLISSHSQCFVKVFMKDSYLKYSSPLQDTPLMYWRLDSQVAAFQNVLGLTFVSDPLQ